MKYWWSCHVQEAAAKPLLMVWNSHESVVAPVVFFLFSWNVNGSCISRRLRWMNYLWFGISSRMLWSHFPNSFQWTIDGLELPGGCCEAIYGVFKWNIKKCNDIESGWLGCFASPLLVGLWRDVGPYRNLLQLGFCSWARGIDCSIVRLLDADGWHRPSWPHVNSCVRL